MTDSLSLLVIDDSEEDFTLILREIEKSFVAPVAVRITSGEELHQMLDNRSWDLIITDYLIPGFGGIQAIEIIRTMCPGIPCIMVSGKIGEESAVEAMKAGADDFIPKENFSRLVPAIRRSLGEAEIRMLKIAADRRLDESRENINALLNVTDNFFYIIKPDGTILDSNESFKKQFEKGSSIIGKALSEFIPHDIIAKGREHIEWIRNNHKESRFSCEVSGQYFDNLIYPVFSASGGLERLIVLSHDITNHRKIEEALHKSEERLSFAMNATNDGLWDWNFASGVFFFSPRYFTMLGYQAGELEGRFAAWEDLIHPDDRGKVCSRLNDFILKGETIFECEFRMRTKENRHRWILSRAKTVAYKSDGSSSRIVGTHVDITEWKFIERKLGESEELFRSFVEQASEGFSLVDSEGRIVEWNKAQELITGFPYEEVKGKFLWEVFGQMLTVDADREIRYIELKRDIQNLLKTGVAPDINRVIYTRIRNRQGEIKDIERLSFTIITRKGIQIGTTTRDISERFQAEEYLRNSLKEKEILLKEIHHRVKNNLQIISSLLHLQERHVKDPSDLAIFRDSKERIKSMSLIHESLYQSKNFAEVDFGGYTRKLIDNLASSYQSDTKTIVTEVKLENVSLSIDDAIPCGLIINELVTNSLKYAFTNSPKGKIMLTMESRDGRCFLEVRDTGTGLPDGFSIENSGTLGMTLVKNLVMQLQGTFRLYNDGGTVFSCDFPSD